MKLLIIIGLPGSGKTTYFNEQLKDQYKFYDDFISDIINGELIDDIKKKEFNICVADPRLCNFQTFLRVINIFLQIVDKKDISLILFENNKYKCIYNSEKRSSKFFNKSIYFLFHIVQLV